MKNQKGITLIALIITIIVMMILVGISVSVAINTGLFKVTSGVSKNTQDERDKEKERSAGKVIIGDKIYDSLEDYVAGKASYLEIKDEAILQEKVNEGWKLDKVTVVTNGRYTVPIPKGFSISEKAGEKTVEDGLVIKDGLENEFVWVPVEDYKNYEENKFGPRTDTKPLLGIEPDSQTILDYYYGNNYYNLTSNFTYEEDKTNVENSIKTYGGFYVGRYETTYDNIVNEVPQGIGVKPGRNVLQASSLLQTGKNEPANENDEKSNEPFYYRWWGLYKAQKDIYDTNHPSVGSLMISSKQWDAIMNYTKYASATREKNTYANKPDKSGSAYEGSNPREYDEAKNIYDLSGNLNELTAISEVLNRRIYRGGSYFFGGTTDNRVPRDPNTSEEYFGSRCALYIK